MEAVQCSGEVVPHFSSFVKVQAGKLAQIETEGGHGHYLS